MWRKGCSVASLQILWFASCFLRCAESDTDPNNLMLSHIQVGQRRLQFFIGGFPTVGTDPPIVTAAPTVGGGGGVGAGGGSIENIADVNTILTFDELYTALSGTNPSPSSIGPGWSNLNIVYILQYYDKPDSWLSTRLGQLMTGIAGVLVMVFLVILMYAIYVCGYRKPFPKRLPRIQSPRRRSVRISEICPAPPDDDLENDRGNGDISRPYYERTRSSLGLPPLYTSPIPDDIPDPLFYEPVHTARTSSTPTEIIVRPREFLHESSPRKPGTGRVRAYFTEPRVD